VADTKVSRTCPLQAGVYLDVMEDYIVIGGIVLGVLQIKSLCQKRAQSVPQNKYCSGWI